MTKIIGNWYHPENQEEKLYFELELDEKPEAQLLLKRNSQAPETQTVFVDFRKRQIKGDFIKIQAIEAVDTAHITYFILQPDISFLRRNKQAFIQAKLVASEPEDDELNGEGVVRSSCILYTVSVVQETNKLDDSKGKKDSKKKKKNPNEIV